MEPIDRLIALDEIRQLKARYVRGVDQKDWSLLKNTYAEDVLLDARGATTDPRTGVNFLPGLEERVYEGADVGIEMVQAAMNSIVSVHHVMTPEIQIISETNASAIWPMTDRLRHIPIGPYVELIGWGHYVETYSRLPEGWKIKTLRLTRLRVDGVVKD